MDGCVCAVYVHMCACVCVCVCVNANWPYSWVLIKGNQVAGDQIMDMYALCSMSPVSSSDTKTGKFLPGVDHQLIPLLS